MRDPAVNVEVAAAIEQARRFLAFFQRHGGLNKGDPERNLRHAARSYIDGLDDDVMPKPLRDYVCCVLAEHPPGRSTYIGRDMFITMAIEATVKRGFAPTRNDASRSKRESACSIVAAALGQLGFEMSERTVEDIWRRRAAVRKIGRKKSRTTT